MPASFRKIEAAAPDCAAVLLLALVCAPLLASPARTQHEEQPCDWLDEAPYASSMGWPEKQKAVYRSADPDRLALRPLSDPQQHDPAPNGFEEDDRVDFGHALGHANGQTLLVSSSGVPLARHQAYLAASLRRDDPAARLYALLPRQHRPARAAPPRRRTTRLHLRREGKRRRDKNPARQSSGYAQSHLHFRLRGLWRMAAP